LEVILYRFLHFPVLFIRQVKQLAIAVLVETAFTTCAFQHHALAADAVGKEK